jgi:hypothetical protein
LKFLHHVRKFEEERQIESGIRIIDLLEHDAEKACPRPDRGRMAVSEKSSSNNNLKRDADSEQKASRFSAPLLAKFVSKGAAMYHELRKGEH